MNFLSLTVDSALVLASAMLSLALFLAFLRLAWGPSLLDRVVALDLITTLVVGATVVYAVATEEPVFLDVALVVALTAFLATVGFAYYVERRVIPHTELADE